MSGAKSRAVSPACILLFGMPRSGTTWVGKTFDSHPETLYLHEPDSARALDSIPLLPELETADVLAPALRAYLDRLPEIRSSRVTGKLPQFPKRFYRPGVHTARRLALLGSKALRSRLTERLVESLPPGLRYPPRFVVWKSIESLGRLGVFVRAAPSVRAVHLLRHPCGYVDSVLRGEATRRFASQVAASEDYGIFACLLNTHVARGYGLDLEALRALHPVERLAWRWVLFNQKAVEDTHGAAGCLAVRYEDICARPAEEYRRLFTHAGLDWDAQTERFLRASTGADRTDYYGVVRDPLKAAERWRTSLAAEDARRVRAVVARTPLAGLYADPAEGAGTPGS